MATVYVSQTAMNGYAVGSDANSYAQAQSKATPKLTLESAITAASAADTIVVNDGSYVAATYFDVAKALTVNPETDYGTTLKCTGAVGQVIRVGAAGVTITLGKLIIDAEDNASASCVGVNGTSARTVLLNGTRLSRPGAARFGVESINSGQVLTLQVRDVDCSDISTTAGVIYCLLGAAAVIDIDGLTVDNSASTGITSASRGPVYLNATAAGTMHIRRVSGIWKTAVGGYNAAFIRTAGLLGVIENNRGIRLTGGDTSGTLIKCENITGVQTDGILIRRNQGTNETTGGFLILVGADGASANDNKTNRAMVYRNDVAGTDAASLMHGIAIGNSLGGCITNNRIRKAAIPTLAKLCAEAVYVIDNDIIDPVTSTSGCLRGKGATNLMVSGNRVRMSSGYTNPAIVFDRDTGVPTLSTGCMAIGNTAYSPVNVPVMVTVGGSGDASAGVFLLNNYRALSYAAGAFVYGAATYSTVATWAAAKELSAFDVVPTTTDIAFWRDSYTGAREAALASMAPMCLPE